MVPDRQVSQKKVFGTHLKKIRELHQFNEGRLTFLVFPIAYRIGLFFKK
jgi:hypothetical protein